MKYKMKAECIHDIMEFMRLAGIEPVNELKKERFWFDVELTFSSKLSQEKILDLLQKIPDSHVMRETLSTEESYTGERTYTG